MQTASYLSYHVSSKAPLAHPTAVTLASTLHLKYSSQALVSRLVLVDPSAYTCTHGIFAR